MFDIGFLELIIVSIVGLLVLGPDRLPGAIRTVSLFVGKLRRSFNGIRAEIERELKADEIRQELHNQSIMQDLRNAQQEINDAAQELTQGLGHDPDLKLGKDGYALDEAHADAADDTHADAADDAHADAAETSHADAADDTHADAADQESKATRTAESGQS